VGIYGAGVTNKTKEISRAKEIHSANEIHSVKKINTAEDLQSGEIFRVEIQIAERRGSKSKKAL
jgi:hypothetical protein